MAPFWRCAAAVLAVAAAAVARVAAEAGAPPFPPPSAAACDPTLEFSRTDYREAKDNPAVVYYPPGAIVDLAWHVTAATIPPSLVLYRRRRGQASAVAVTPSYTRGGIEWPRQWPLPEHPMQFRHAVATWTATDADEGAELYAEATLTCGGGGGGGSRKNRTQVLRSTPTRLVTTSRGLPTVTGAAPLCPVSARAARVDLAGMLLNDGAVTRQPSCAACRAACVRLPGCAVWVWGAARGGRHRQCWLKAAKLVGDRNIRAGAAAMRVPTGGTPWAAGTIPVRERRATCRGDYGVDLAGEVLVAGDTHRVADCVACAAACRATPRCNVWVYGVVGYRSARHRQCWLKRSWYPVRPKNNPDARLWVSGSFDPPRRRAPS